EAIAKSLYDHYRRDLYENVAGGAGISVIYRSTPKPGSNIPIDIDFDDSETSAIILLLDEHWVADADWVTWAHDLLDRADSAGLAVRVFPVAIDEDAMKLRVTEQAVRWDKWTTLAPDDRERRLIG